MFLILLRIETHGKSPEPNADPNFEDGALDAFGSTTGLSVAWGRLFFFCGLGEKPGRLVSDAIRTLRAGQRFATSPGLQRRDFLHVAGALTALLGSERRGAVNIDSVTAVPMRDILLRIAALTCGHERIDFGTRLLAATRPTCIEADTAHLRTTGLAPRHTLADTITAWKGQQH